MKRYCGCFRNIFVCCLVITAFLFSTFPAQAAPPATVCVHRIAGLKGLLGSNERKRVAGVALKNSAEPFIEHFRNLSLEERGELVRQEQDKITGELAKYLPEDFGQKIGNYARELGAFEKELARVEQTISPPACYPTISKDLGTFLATKFADVVEGKLTPLFTSHVQSIPRWCDNRFIVADQTLFNIMKTAIDGRYQDRRWSQELALYLACAGSEIRLLDKAVYEGGQAVLAMIDQRGWATAKPMFVGLLAPILMSMCDVSGINNPNAKSCAFLRENNALWVKDIQTTGLRGGGVYLWDRQSAQFVFFPVGKPRTGAQNCTAVNPAALANTYGSRGMLNFNDCGMALNIASCPQTLGGQQFYPNLCHRCDDTQKKGNSNAPSPPLLTMGPGVGQQGSTNVTGSPNEEGFLDAQCSLIGENRLRGGGNTVSSQNRCGPSLYDQTHPHVCGADQTPNPRSANMARTFFGAPTGERCRDSGLTSGTDPRIIAPSVKAAMARAFAAEGLVMQGVEPISGVPGAIRGTAVPLERAVTTPGNFFTAAATLVGNILSSFLIAIDPNVVREKPPEVASDDDNKGDKPGDQREHSRDREGAVGQMAGDPTPTDGSSGGTAVAGANPIDPFVPTVSPCTWSGQLMHQVDICFVQEVTAALTSSGIPMATAPPVGGQGIVNPWAVNPNPSEETLTLGACGSGVDLSKKTIDSASGFKNKSACEMMVCGNQLSLGVGTGCCGMDSGDVQRVFSTNPACARLYCAPGQTCTCAGEGETRPASGRPPGGPTPPANPAAMQQMGRPGIPNSLQGAPSFQPPAMRQAAPTTAPPTGTGRAVTQPR